MIAPAKNYLKDKTIVRYIFSGGSAYLLEIATLYTLSVSAGFSPVVSVAISFWVGLISSFLLQKIVTFRSRNIASGKLSAQIASYLLLVVFNYTISLGTVWLLHEYIPVYVLRSVLIAAATIWNYLLFKRWIFG